MFKIICREPDHWKCREQSVIGHVHQHMVDQCAWEIREQTEEEDRWRNQDVLIKDVGRGVGVSSIGLTTVHKEQVGKVFELSYCVVGCFGCLLSFKTTYADSNVRCRNHIYIICTIADSQRSLLWVPVLDHIDDFCFLFWADTAGKDYVRILA